MPPRYRTSILVVFVLTFLYYTFPFSSREDDARVLNAGTASGEAAKPDAGHGALLHDDGEPPLVKTVERPNSIQTSSAAPLEFITSTSVMIPEATEAASKVQEEAVSQAQFNTENDALGVERSAGKIYGSSLNDLVGIGNHAGFAAAMLKATESWTPYNDAPPFTYNPYPEYNDKAWNATNTGAYVPCDGPDGEVREVLVFSGHPLAFESPSFGSYVPLGIDSNLCFERESRLSAYGYVEEGTNALPKSKRLSKSVDWDAVNWGQLQKHCVETNANRYVGLEARLPVNDTSIRNSSDSEKHISDSSTSMSGSKRSRNEEPQIFNGTITDEAEAKKLGLHGLAKNTVGAKTRTAVLLRSYTGKNYTENDKQNIRSLVTELTLRSGGEYQVYLLVQIKDSDVPQGVTDASQYKEVIEGMVPKEFWEMVVVWNDAMMKEWYPKVPKDINNVHQSQWLSVQKFAQEHPQFEHYWNWELDSRYTGHHYNLLERLAEFAYKQPRKGLWERNERFYIPSLYGDYYDSKFRTTVEAISRSETIWGAPLVASVTAVGPKPPVASDKEDNYKWGVEEEADLITLSPIFNPVNTGWPGRDDVWGYAGVESTPRRATIGTQSRISKTLLNTMHLETKNGNHLSSEMAPQTVALLHGLKAVYAPIPVFFDRAWEGGQLDKWFNPGPKGVSGSTEESPFSWEREGRFAGSTWYFRATSPMRLYNNWMGWEDSGIGGLEWEKKHGRMCLPPILLHPIKDVMKPPPGHFSKSDLPY